MTGCGFCTQDHNAVMNAETITLFPICNISSMKLCANLPTVCAEFWSGTIIGDSERKNSAEFSDLYLWLLSAALDEKSSSGMPQIRERSSSPCQLRDFRVIF